MKRYPLPIAGSRLVGSLSIGVLGDRYGGGVKHLPGIVKVFLPGDRLSSAPCGGSKTMLKNPFSPRLLKKVQMQGGAPIRWVPGAVRDVLSPYVAAPRERANAADGSFSAAC